MSHPFLLCDQSFDVYNGDENIVCGKAGIFTVIEVRDLGPCCLMTGGIWSLWVLQRLQLCD